MRSVFLIVLSLFLLFIIYTAAIYFFQRKLLYRPDTKKADRKNYAAEHYQEVSFVTDDKLELYGWYHAAKKGLPTLIYFHGNASHLGTRIDFLNQFIPHGVGVFIFSYRGYAGNPGKPTEKGLYLDASAAITYLRSKGVKQLVAYGESLGSGVAVEMAYRKKVDGLILQSPYSSMIDVAKFHYPLILISPKDKFLSFQKMPHIKLPTLIFHGDKDAIIPLSLANKLYHAANHPKRLIVLKGLAHNDIQTDKLLKTSIDYLRSLMPDTDK